MKYSIEELNAFNLHSLRILARNFGVKSPSSLKKSVLVDEILNIQNGIKNPYFSNKKGRPVKRYVTLQKNNGDTEIVCENTLRTQLKKEFISTILQKVEKLLNDVL